MAVALTRTASTARTEVSKAIGSVFDRPTPWALRSVRIRKATKERLRAEVFLVDRRGDPQDQPHHYLYPQVFGGARGRKGFESLLAQYGVLPQGYVTVPGSGAKLDRFGNQARGELVQILSALSAGPSAGAGKGYTYNRTTASKKRRGSRLRDIFYSSPSLQQRARNGGRLPWGVWERTADGRVQCLLFFVKQASYRKRLPLFAIAERVIERDLSREYDKALAFALRTAR
ncbi:MAG TPA: hypothetical protein P5163_21095 [Rubrivivax sp.]|nr:hypothetical protein [Rubrivivax sp.]